MRLTVKQSPNSSSGMKPQGICLHHTGGSFSGAVAWCMNPQSKVSYHCIVDTDGNRTQLVADNRRAWHAGVSTFKGRSNCNTFLLGIAVSNDTTNRVLNDLEVNSVAEWCVEKMRLHGFGLDMITTHREIAPRRKNDVDLRAEQAIKARISQLLGQKSTAVAAQPTLRNHTVVRGDTLSGLARQYNTTVAAIRQANNLTNDIIRVGQVLKMP
jgi:N-acetyl-anhydromuramoyl-L-alanine amidase